MNIIQKPSPLDHARGEIGALPITRTSRIPEVETGA